MADVPNFEIIGPPDAPVVVVLGGISASRHVAAHSENPTPGWWEAIVGPGRAIDTDRVRVLSIDYLDGGRGSDGRPKRIVTTHDQAEAIARALSEIAVLRARAIVGASYGGMVALAFAQSHPARVQQLVVISAPHEAHPMSTALRALQRRIVQLGIDTGEQKEALALARGLAMTTYRSAREFGERFDAEPLERTANDAIFPVEGYLRHHGEKFAAAWTPERFLALSLSADLHRVDPAAIRTPALLVAAEGDAIVPGEQMAALAARFGAPNQLVELPSKTGHDAFLTEPEALGRLLRQSLATTRLS
ncbi:MAG TPA: homoserine O-succinyltransferase [Gemmatimonadaceae bacterium]|nr:homoserine O-succinyltransferase [Gemmatimonadaceae bacterium]